MTGLETKLNAILNDKLTNLKPENLKKGVTCLGVTGTLETSTSSGGIKQFSTIEEMNSSTGNTEGDLAVVYRSEVQNATVDSRFQVATFPDTVVLDTAITGSIDLTYKAVDNSITFDCRGSLDSSSFRMDCYIDNGSIRMKRINYTSSDGITYTRTDNNGNPVDFVTEIYYKNSGMWNDAIGKFIQIGGNVFEGLYKANPVVNYKRLKGYRLSYSNDVVSYIEEEEPRYTEIVEMMQAIATHAYEATTTKVLCEIAFIKDDTAYIFIRKTNASNAPVIAYQSSGELQIGSFAYSSSHPSTEYVYSYDFSTKTISRYKTFTNTSDSSVKNNTGIMLDGYLCVPLVYKSSTETMINHDGSFYAWLNTGSEYLYNDFLSDIVYEFAPTQLSATADYVYEKEFYGVDGVKIGTLQNKENLTKDGVKRRVEIWSSYNSGIVCPNDSSHMFRGCTSLTTIPLLDTSNVTHMGNMFQTCTSLTIIPLLDTSSVTSMSYMFDGCTSLTTIPLLDTSKAVNMMSMFQTCTSLTTIPLLDTSSVTNIVNMFRDCTSLSDESLNNILAMCANATSYTGAKTLDYIGLTSDQATKCTTLSNYSAFTAAGWTTGY